MSGRLTVCHWSRGVSLLVLLLAMDTAGPLSAADDPRPVPGGVADLRALEAAAARVVERVLPATVGVELGPVQASGVVVSEDGYVLTASHVAGGPGRRVRLIFPDGRRADGETLGLNPDVDGALIRITESGKWPFAPLATAEALPRAGDWCVALGHPGSYQADRSPPVRFGRIVDADRYVIRTDCTIAGGDSGGPLFDLEGRVIGIHSRITESSTMNLHVPAITFVNTWEQLKSGEVSRITPRSRFLATFDFDQDGLITRTEIPEGPYRSTYDRLAERYAFDPHQPQPLEDLREMLGLKVTEDPPERGRFGFAADTVSQGTAAVREMLPSSLFTRGPELLRSFREVVTTARECTVAFTQRGEIVVLGTVVGADGWVVTKASELESAREQPGSTSPLRCRLSDGRHVSFEEVGVDPVHDLVLLKVDADRLKPVTWGDAAGLQLGNWLVSSGTGPSPVSVGVVSVLARKLSGSPGYMGIAGSETAEGPVIVDVQRGSGAARAGLRTGDLITHIGDEPVTVFADVSRTVQQHRPGSMIDVTVRRGETAEKVTVRLGVHPEAVSGGSNRLTGPLSMRRDNFPSVIQHDSVLHPAECGGPVVSLRGQVIGINIARAERTASYLLPADVVRRVIDELMP